MFGKASALPMKNFFTKLLLLFISAMVVDMTQLENSCPDYLPYYCACSFMDIAEIKQIKMCFSESLERSGCHPCPEHLQEDANCKSCSDDTCPICSVHNFGAGQSYDSRIKQHVFFKFAPHHGIVHIQPLESHPGFDEEGSIKHHISEDVKDTSNKTVPTNYEFLGLKEKPKLRSPDEIREKDNVPGGIDVIFSDPKNLQQRNNYTWLKSPNQRNSQTSPSAFRHLELKNDEGFDKKPLNLLMKMKDGILEFTLSGKRKDPFLNESNLFQPYIGKFKYGKGNNHIKENAEINSLHNLPSHKGRHMPLKISIKDSKVNLDENSENVSFVSLHITGDEFKLKTPEGDKCYFKSVPNDSVTGNSSKNQIFNFHCSVTDAPNNGSFVKYIREVLAIEKEAQKCISDHFTNVFNSRKHLELFEISCKVPLPLMVLWKFIKFVVDNKTQSSNAQFKETVKVWPSNFDDIEFIVELNDLSLEQLNNLSESNAHDKKSRSYVKGKLKIDTRLHLNKPEESFLNETGDDVTFSSGFSLKNAILDNVSQLENCSHVPLKPGFSEHGSKQVIIRNFPVLEKQLDIGTFINNLMSNLLSGENVLDEQSGHLEYAKIPLTHEKSVSNPIRIFQKTRNLFDFSALKGFDFVENSIKDLMEWINDILNISLNNDGENAVKQSRYNGKIFFYQLNVPDILKQTDFPNRKPNFTLKRVYRDTSKFPIRLSVKDPDNSDEIVVTYQSILKLFTLNLDSVKQQSPNMSDILWFRYRRYILIPKMKGTLPGKNFKNSEIFDMLNASISNLKESKMYNADCETCSVIYKVMLDNEFKSDPKLVGNGNSSVIALMNKPQIVYDPSKEFAGRPRKFRRITKNNDSVTVHMNIDLLFLSSDDYKNLIERNISRSNLLWSTPWRNLSEKFVFRIPESFNSQSKILNLRKSLRRKNLKSVIRDLIDEGQFIDEFQKIVFALLLKMHAPKTADRINHLDNASVVLPTLSSEMTKYKEIKKSDDVQEGKKWLGVNWKGESNSSADSREQDHNKGFSKISGHHGHEKRKKIWLKDKKEFVNGRRKHEGMKDKTSLSFRKTGEKIDLESDVAGYNENHSLYDLKEIKPEFIPMKENPYNVTATEHHKDSTRRDGKKYSDGNENQNISKKTGVLDRKQSSQQHHEEALSQNREEFTMDGMRKVLKSVHVIRDNLEQFKNDVAESKKKYLKNWEKAADTTLKQKSGEFKELKNATIQVRDRHAGREDKTADRETSYSGNQSLKITGFEKTTSSKNASVGNYTEAENNTNNASENFKRKNEMLATHNSQQQVFGDHHEKIKETHGVFGFKDVHNETGDQSENEIQTIREDTWHYLKGNSRIRRSLQNSDQVSDYNGTAIRLKITDEDFLHPRRKRFATDLPHNGWCGINTVRRNADLDCLIWTFKKKCKIECHPGYTYGGSQTVETGCARRGNNWTPDINRPCSGSGPDRPRATSRGVYTLPSFPKVPHGKAKPIFLSASRQFAPPDDKDDDQYYDDYDYGDK